MLWIQDICSSVPESEAMLLWQVKQGAIDPHALQLQLHGQSMQSLPYVHVIRAACCTMAVLIAAIWLWGASHVCVYIYTHRHLGCEGENGSSEF